MREITRLIQNSVSDLDIKKLGKIIPKEWKDSVGSDKIGLLTDFIKFRIRNLDKICEMIILERSK